MKLCAGIQSERGKEVQKTGNEFIGVDFTIGRSETHRFSAGRVELRVVNLNDKIFGERDYYELVYFSPDSNAGGYEVIFERTTERANVKP